MWTKFCLVQDRIQGIHIVNNVISLWVLWKAMNFLTRWVNVFLKKGSTTWIYSEAIEGYLMAKPLPPPQWQGLLMSGLEGNTVVGRLGSLECCHPQTSFCGLSIIILYYCCVMFASDGQILWRLHFIQFVFLWRLILCLNKLCCSILVHFWYFYRCSFTFKHFTS